ncbi:hypothetical protein AHAS_Ahas07G0140200 [Arachis hypogaea]
MIGSVLEVGLFMMKGRETRIIKAKFSIKESRRTKDSLTIVDPNRKEVEIDI